MAARPGFLAPGFEERRTDDALRHLLDAEHQHRVVLPGPDRARRELQRGAAARAAGFDVDDRLAGQRERAQAPCDPTRRRRTRCRRTRPGSADSPASARRSAHRVHTHLGRGHALEAPERVETDAGYANAHVTTPVRATRRQRASSLDRTPAGAGSASRRRVMTRSCSCTSSTTPNPYGTAPVYPGGAAVTAVHAHNVASRDNRHAFHIGRARVGARVEQRKVVLGHSSGSSRRST